MQVAVVMPAYRSSSSILDVLSRIPAVVSKIYVVDDACPEGTGRMVESITDDPRIKVLYNEQNLGVGGAVKRGYVEALAGDADVIVKIDSDGQMAPELLEQIAGPVIRGEADYSKGNRFHDLRDLKEMPSLRIFGNAVLSFLSKFSTGYWRVFDPTNGYTAIARPMLARIPLDRVANRFFFESDLLFRLGLERAVVEDVPMRAIYGSEKSNLKAHRVILPFVGRHLVNFLKRIVIDYFVRDFNFASLSVLVAGVLLPLGLLYGVVELVRGLITGVPSSTSSVALVSLLLVIGYMSLLNFLSFDYGSRTKS